MGVLILGLIVVAAMVLFTALVHPVLFIVNTLQGLLVIAGVIMLFFSVQVGIPLGPGWASVLFTATILLLFGANRLSILKARLMNPSR